MGGCILQDQTSYKATYILNADYDVITAPLQIQVEY